MFLLNFSVDVALLLFQFPPLGDSAFERASSGVDAKGYHPFCYSSVIILFEDSVWCSRNRDPLRCQRVP